MVLKRSRPPLHLSRTPLIYVVTQVRFSPVMSIEKYIPDIQEKLRHKYPWFNQSKVQEFVFQAQGPPNVTFSDRYEFLQGDKRTGVVLMSNSAALHTNKYSNYEVFQEEFAECLSVIHENVGIGFVERIGLRYVDLVKLDPNETWADYINPGLLGLDAATVGVEQWSSQFRCIGKTEAGTLSVRYSQSKQPLPPDLMPVTLHYEKEPLEPKEVGTILDFDHYSEQTRDFQVEAVVSAIGELHDNLDQAFRSAVTRAALKKWE